MSRQPVAELITNSVTPSLASKVTYSGGAIAGASGFLLSNVFFALMGLLIGVIGLCFQIYLGLDKRKRDIELHRLRVSSWDGETERRRAR